MKVSVQDFNALCKIIDSPTSTIIASNLIEHFGSSGKKLITIGALIHVGNRNDIESPADHDGKSVEVHRYQGKNVYFSPAVGWVEVPSSELKLYSFCPIWLTTFFKDALGIADHVEPKEIIEGKAWALGNAQLKHLKHPIILVLQLRKESVFGAIKSYLEQHHKKRPALVISFDYQMSPYFSLPSQNRHVILSDAIDMNAKNFSLNIDFLAERMSASIQQQGFSNGYRTAYINGHSYTFTEKQAEALEVMDQAGRPMHQIEILAQTSSQQKRLNALFRNKGKAHPAWNVIIINDGDGNYQLEY